MDPNRGFNSLYVYCDAAEAIPVGDIKAPLLRVVDAAGNFGDLIHRLYTTPQYVPISTKEFNTLEIDIRNDTGRPVPFEFGKVVAILNFREAVIRTSYDDQTVLLRSTPSAIRRLLYEAKRRRGTFFYGARTQRGHGLGSILGRLIRRTLPFLSSGVKILVQHAINGASDMIDGKSFQDSAKSRIKKSI